MRRNYTIGEVLLALTESGMRDLDAMEVCNAICDFWNTADRTDEEVQTVIELIHKKEDTPR